MTEQPASGAWPSVPEVTASIDACCLRCLDKNPWRRYSRAYDVFMRLGSLRSEREEAKRS